MLKKIFAKKSVQGTNEQDKGKSKFGTSPPASPKTKSQKRLDSSSSGTKFKQTDYDSISQNSNEEVRYKYRANRDLEFKCSLCKVPDGIVRAEGYCTDCKQYVCTSCIEWHCKKDYMADHILLELKLIDKKVYQERALSKATPNNSIEIFDDDDEYGVDETDDSIIDGGIDKKPIPENMSNGVAEDIRKMSENVSGMTVLKEAFGTDKDLDKRSELDNNSSETAKELSNKVDRHIIEMTVSAKQVNNVEIRVSKTVTNIPCDAKGMSQQTKALAKNENNKAVENGEQRKGAPSSEAFDKISQSNGVKNNAENIPEKFTFVKDIKAKYEGDMKNCFISEIAVLSDKRVAVLDDSNKNIKTLHIEWGMDGVIQFSNHIGAITSLPEEKIAVTIPAEKRIKLLSTINEISVVANIRFLVEYNHVVYSNGKLLVSMHDPLQFRMLGLDGTVLQKVIPVPEVARCITSRDHMYIDISEDEQTIYVSNTDTKCILAMNMDGSMVSYKDDDIDTPTGISVGGAGELYVGDREKHGVYRMTKDFKESKVILSKADGLSFPQCVCYDSDKRLMFISSKSDDRTCCNNIKMFKC